MTRAAALYKFFSQFNIPAYEETSVPDDVIFPYLTYQDVTPSWNGGKASGTVKLWYYTESNVAPNAKADELSRAIGLNGTVITFDEGAIWLTKGDPWCLNTTDENNKKVKLRYINVSYEALS